MKMLQSRFWVTFGSLALKIAVFGSMLCLFTNQHIGNTFRCFGFVFLYREEEGDEREIEKNIEIYLEGVGDREGMGGKEPIPETEEQRKQRMIAMVANYQFG